MVQLAIRQRYLYLLQIIAKFRHFQSFVDFCSKLAMKIVVEKYCNALKITVMIIPAVITISLLLKGVC